MDNLKERERRILAYMKEEIRKKGYPPTVREICAALNIKSTSTAHKDIESLVKQGYIIKDPSKPRALMITDPDDAGDIYGEGAGSAYDAGAADGASQDAWDTWKEEEKAQADGGQEKELGEQA